MQIFLSLSSVFYLFRWMPYSHRCKPQYVCTEVVTIRFCDVLEGSASTCCVATCDYTSHDFIHFSAMRGKNRIFLSNGCIVIIPDLKCAISVTIFIKTQHLEVYCCCLFGWAPLPFDRRAPAQRCASVASYAARRGGLTAGDGSQSDDRDDSFSKFSKDSLQLRAGAYTSWGGDTLYVIARAGP